MSMTREERIAKNEILRILARSGYPTYASLLDEFEVNLTEDPGVVGYMEPNKGRIVLNRGLDLDQVSTIVRHEILHQYLEHEKRLLKNLSKNKNLNFDDLDDASIADLKRELYSNKDFNYAADYEISNRGYTDKDKDIIRNIKLNGQILNGLVTEDDHPDWVEMSVEEMYNELQKLRKKDSEMEPEVEEEQAEEEEIIYGDFIDDTTFVSNDNEVWGSGSLIDHILKSTKEILNRPEVTPEMRDEIMKGLLAKGFPEEAVDSLFN